MQPTLGTSLHAMFILNTTFNAPKDPTIGPELCHKTSGKPLSLTHTHTLSLSLSLSLSPFYSHYYGQGLQALFSFVGGSPLYLLERDPTPKNKEHFYLQLDPHKQNAFQKIHFTPHHYFSFEGK
jgi:hypothetical protein